MKRTTYVTIAKKLFGYAFLIILVLGSGVTAKYFGPTEFIYADDSWDDVESRVPPGYNSSEHNVILDQHSHTIHSDGSLTVVQNVEWHISMGYNVVFITDHNTMKHVKDIEKVKQTYLDQGVLVIQGMEWTTNRIHMNFLGLQNWTLSVPSNPTNAQIQNAINEAHSQGAVVTVNHIPWSTEEANMDTHPSRSNLEIWGVDYFEIVNDVSDPENVLDQESWDFVNSNSAAEITGTDMHKPNTLTGKSIHGATFLFVDEFSESAVMDQLRLRNTTISYFPEGVRDEGVYQRNSKYLLVQPLVELGNFVMSIYYAQNRGQVVAVTVAYFVAIVLLVQSLKHIVKKRKKIPSEEQDQQYNTK